MLFLFTGKCLTFCICSSMSRFIVSFVTISCDYFSAQWHVYRIFSYGKIVCFVNVNVIVFCSCYSLCDKLLPWTL